MNTILDLLGRTEVQTAVIAALAFGFGLLKKLEAVEKWKLQTALECLEAGVRDTYEEYVRAIKVASEDGKLEDAERKEAMSRAVAKAKEYAASEGVDMLKVYAKEYLPVLVERIIASRKTSLPFVSVPGSD